MSKVDAQRAMKAARHAGAPAPATPVPTTPVPARPAPARPAPVRPAAATGATGTAAVTVDGPATPVEPGTGPAAAEQLCGHRNMAGRECRRPAGHAEKSHRYS